MRDVPVLAVDLLSLNEQRRNSSYTAHGNTNQSVADIRAAASGLRRDLAANLVRGLTLSTISNVRYVSPGLIAWNPSLGRFVSVGGELRCCM
jgi:hypothetical protein